MVLMELEDRTLPPPELTEKQFAAQVVELLKLVDGLESGTHTCACRRYYRIGISAELKQLLPRIRREALARAGQPNDEYNPDSTRFSLLEVD